MMLKSGVHATIAGVLLAFTIPSSTKLRNETSPSNLLEHSLNKPVAFFILPVFALANTGIAIGTDWQSHMFDANGMGIMAGLVIGKPLGILLFSLIAVYLGLCRLPKNVNWKHIFGAGLLGGIGFTMSIFISNLAFAGNAEIINASKLAIFMASFLAGLVGYTWLRYFSKP